MKILILGCGWVGEEVAKSYKKDGVDVYVTCTSEEKRQRLAAMGWNTAVVDFDQEERIPHFPAKFDFVLNSIPASSRSSEEKVFARFRRVRKFLEAISFRKQILLSSGGIYPDEDDVFEESYSEKLNLRLLGAEQFVSLNNTVIYRLGGLFGKERIFAKYFQHKICTTGEQPANFVHVDDVVRLILSGFESELKSTRYNIVAPEHPKKKEVILASAKKYGFALPSSLVADPSFQKIVDGSAIVRDLNYSYIFPSPLNF